MTTLAEALAPKSDQLNADDLIPGPRTIKITDARITRGDRQTRVTLNFEGDNGKPFKPCKTMGRAMVMVWGITDEKEMIGKSIRVYRDPDVKFGDQGAVGGIRISHMSHIEKPVTVKLTVSQGKKGNFVFQPLPGVVAEQREDAAAKWAANFRDAVSKCGDAETLDSLVAKHAAKLDQLKANRLELHAECETQIEATRAGFDFGGRTDEQHGDQFAGDDFGSGE